MMEVTNEINDRLFSIAILLLRTFRLISTNNGCSFYNIDLVFVVLFYLENNFWNKLNDFISMTIWMDILRLSLIVQLCCLMCLRMSVECERMLENKMETKVEIEVDYSTSVQGEPGRLVHKSVHFSYSVPSTAKTLASEPRGSSRQSSGSSGGSSNNLRHGFRFSNIEKGAGAFTMSTYENEGPETGMRVRNNLMIVGKLIHVLSVAQQGTEGGTNTSESAAGLSWAHNACQDTVNSVQGHWVALVQTGACSPDRKLRQIMKLPNQPLSILIYGSSQVLIKQDSFVSLNQEDTPMVIFLPWNNIQGVVQKCFNSSGQITLPSELLNRMNRSRLDWPFNSQNQCNVTIKVYTTSDDNFLNKTSVLFVSISFILLMVISLAWLMFYYVQRFRYIHTKEQFSRRLAHMAKKAVAKIPVKTIKQGDKETDPEVDNCAICIECYKPSDTVRILPCKHYFHKSCIDPWLLEQRSCPMCKLNILHAYGFLPNERGSLISEDRLSELDSSLELQIIPNSTITPYPGSSTRIQTHCPIRDLSDSSTSTVPPITSTIITLPSIFTSEPNSQGRWMSLRLKRPLRNSSTHHIDRSISLRHLSSSSSAEERTTFLPHNCRPLSQSAISTTLEPRLTYCSQWGNTSTSSSSAAAAVILNVPGDCQSEELSQ